MSLSIEQEVIESIRILPEDKQKKVLEYVKKIGIEDEDEKPVERKFMQKIEELRKKLPDDAFEGSPTDGSLNHDHYLYGSPKREVR
jgi:ssDNA-specific exonuclease RecJ